MIGCQKLCHRFRNDRCISDLILDELNKRKDDFNTKLKVYSYTPDIDKNPKPEHSTGIPGAYAGEKQQEIALPPLEELPNVIKTGDPIKRNFFNKSGKVKNIQILTKERQKVFWIVCDNQDCQKDL
ncbi:MAG: hypothetical protein J1E64_02240 [Acetatifactor sp.]|nr:hypothetical protein [Acetatifactor sp.]